jgi:hypothetical protein
MKKKYPLLLLLTLVSATPLFSQSSGPSNKQKVEQVVAKHLESIGTEQARASIKTRIIAGSSQVIFRTTPVGQAYGRGVLASDGEKSLIGMSFNSPVYPREEFGFNGKSFIAAFVTPGVRSSLGSFLMNHSILFKQGLMGGTLSSAWFLLDASSRNPELEYVGLKKVGERQAHEIKYVARGASELQISLFFDEVTFQHVRTEYRRVIAASTGTRAYTNVDERETRYKLVEEFSNFDTEKPLHLPHTYKIHLTVDAQTGTFEAEWVLKLTEFTFNQKIDPNSFSITARGPKRHNQMCDTRLCLKSHQLPDSVPSAIAGGHLVLGRLLSQTVLITRTPTFEAKPRLTSNIRHTSSLST